MRQPRARFEPLRPRGSWRWTRTSSRDHRRPRSTRSPRPSRALPKLLEEKKALLAAWNGGEAIARTLLVSTHVGDVEVSLRAPYEREPARHKPPYDVLADLFELARDGDAIDTEARKPLEDELVRRFVASPEAKLLTDVQVPVCTPKGPPDFQRHGTREVRRRKGG